MPIKITTTRVLSKGFKMITTPIITDNIPVRIWKGLTIAGNISLKYEMIKTNPITIAHIPIITTKKAAAICGLASIMVPIRIPITPSVSINCQFGSIFLDLMELTDKRLPPSKSVTAK